MTYNELTLKDVESATTPHQAVARWWVLMSQPVNDITEADTFAARRQAAEVRVWREKVVPHLGELLLAIERNSQRLFDTHDHITTQVADPWLPQIVAEAEREAGIEVGSLNPPIKARSQIAYNATAVFAAAAPDRELEQIWPPILHHRS